MEDTLCGPHRHRTQGYRWMKARRCDFFPERSTHEPVVGCMAGPGPRRPRSAHSLCSLFIKSKIGGSPPHAGGTRRFFMSGSKGSARGACDSDLGSAGRQLVSVSQLSRKTRSRGPPEPSTPMPRNAQPVLRTAAGRSFSLSRPSFSFLQGERYQPLYFQENIYATRYRPDRLSTTHSLAACRIQPSHSTLEN